MREKIGSLMKEKEDDEDMRIKKAQREMEGKQERELAEKLAKTRTALDMIAQHRVKEVGRPTLPTTTSHCYSLYLLHLIFTLFIDYVFINTKNYKNPGYCVYHNGSLSIRLVVHIWESQYYCTPRPCHMSLGGRGSTWVIPFTGLNWVSRNTSNFRGI